MACREQILSEDYYDVITDFPGLLRNNLYNLCYASVDNLYDIIYLNKSFLTNSREYFYEYRSLPKLYGLMAESSFAPDSLKSEGFATDSRQSGGFAAGSRVADGFVAGSFDPSSLTASGITQIQRPPLGLKGRGVILCVIDTGIDYTSPMFRRVDGSSRILAIWDQTVQTGEPPAGFQYGTEYTREEIDRALAAEAPFQIVPSRDEIGHGTALAAVAAGSVTSDVLGAAPDADLVVVKLKPCKNYLREFYQIPQEVPAYQENDIMLAAKYADSFAVLFKRPVVICLGLGTASGDHAGSSALSRYLSAIAVKRSRVVVVAGGNEGNAAHHYQGNLDNRGKMGANTATVEVRVDRQVSGFVLELWGSLPDYFTVSVRSPGGETIPPVRLGIRESITYGFVYERTRVTVSGNLVEPASGEELIFFRLQDPTPGIWTFVVEAVGEIHNGTFHMWLPVTQFLDAPVTFTEPSPDVTLTEPAMAAEVIAVSAYDAASNGFSIDSGRGFSKAGRIRPDFAAPGVAMTTGNGRSSGSSLAAALTAGAVAQFLQWAVVEGNDPLVESREIKSYLIRGASRGFDRSYPNREWGYGRLNMEGTFDALIGV